MNTTTVTTPERARDRVEGLRTRRDGTIFHSGKPTRADPRMVGRGKVSEEMDVRAGWQYRSKLVGSSRAS